jgi:uncharacterized membrane protein
MDERSKPELAVPEGLHAAVAAIENDERTDVLVRQLERFTPVVERGQARKILSGEWLGHALHPALTDVPIGFWVSAGVLDLVGGKKSRRATQRLIGLGLLAVPPTAASGLSDWSGIREPRDRRVGAVHAVGNVVVALLYYRSWRARRHGHHYRGVLLSTAGAVGAMATAYLGGHLAFGSSDTEEKDTDLTRDAVRVGASGATNDELVDLTRASQLIGVPVAQVQAMVDEGLLDPVSTEPDLRFRDSDVRAVRLLGA